MSSTRLTSLDASFLEVESPTAHMHVGWASVFAPPPCSPPPRFTDLRDHVESRLGRGPRYRQKLAEVPLGMSEPVWVDDPDFDIMRHVHRARSGDFHEIADMVMSAPLDHDRPLWELWIAGRLAAGRIGIVGKVHHCMVDGIAAVELATLLLDPTADPEPVGPDGGAPEPKPSGVSRMVGGVVDQLRGDLGILGLPARVARS